MKKLISILLVLIMLPMVVAQTGQGIAPVEPTTPQQLVVEQPSVATKTAVKPGVTPDSPLWALDVLFGRNRQRQAR